MKLLFTVIVWTVELYVIECSAPLKFVHESELRHQKLLQLYPFQNVSLDWKTRVDDLVSRLTVDEVIQQMSYGGASTSGPAPPISRLGIGPFQWDSECLRGYVEAGPATSFPDSINLASTFDKSIVYKVGQATGKEARAKHADFAQHGQYGDHTGLNCFSPEINMMVHPLWGRSHETYGEDPSLTAQFAAQYVRGLMGDHPRYYLTSANCKGLAGYEGPEDKPVNRISFNTLVSEVDMRMTFLPQFEACVEAGVAGMMCSYNGLNGVPACANKWLLTKVLREEWNFTGFVVSDEDAVVHTIQESHFFSSSEEAAWYTVKSGLNLELSWPGTGPPILLNLRHALEHGKIDAKLLYERVWPLFYTRMRLGEFDPPEMNPYTKYNLSIIQSPAQKNLSLYAAKKSFILLKRTDETIPVKGALETLTLIGPFSNTTDQFFGDYSPTPDKHNTTNVEEGLRNLLEDAKKMSVVAGCGDPTCRNYDATQRGAVLAAAKTERNLIVLALGTGQMNEREANDRGTLELPGSQPQILLDVVGVAETSGVPIVLLLFTASPANITRAVESKAVRAIIQCGFAAQETGVALAHVLTMADSDSNPAGRLPYTWYKDASQLPAMTDYDMRNKTYRFLDGSTKPLFNFGFGLSYSQFNYAFTTSAYWLKVAPEKEVRVASQYEILPMNVSVTNSGPYFGDAVIQIYARWPTEVYEDAEFERVPVLQLLSFERVPLKVGETQIVTMRVETKWLRLWTKGHFVIPPGSYTLFVGGGQPNESETSAVGSKVRLHVSRMQ